MLRANDKSEFAATRAGLARAPAERSDSLWDGVLLLVEGDETNGLLEHPHQAQDNQQQRKRLHCNKSHRRGMSAVSFELGERRLGTQLEWSARGLTL